VTTPVWNALSIDVEEYYHAILFQEATSGGSRTWPSRVEASVDRVLRLLARHDIRATFFTLGEVARAHPAMVRTIAGAGHEIACHGHRHQEVWRQSREGFAADVTEAKAVLEDIVGQPVLGYRAPNFSIRPDGAWAYDVLAEVGFAYDSSIYPIVHDRYGWPGAPRFPYRLAGQNGHRLLEFPIGTARVGGVNFPIGGGGYFRLLPLTLVSWGIRRVNTCEDGPVMFYFHPWELDPDQPRAAMPCAHRVRHYLGLARHEAKLGRLLETVRFTTARAVLGLA
jgi:polysaccharide deacetylase family protein (PEP-CTERM system associated)